MTHYEILGVEQDAATEQIKEKYLSLAKKWHPDKNPDNREEATTRFQAISEAYNTLIDPEQRQRYDYKLQAEQFAAQSPQNPYTSHDPYNPWNTANNTYNPHVQEEWFWNIWEETPPIRRKANPILRTFKWIFWGWVALKFLPVILGLIISIAPIFIGFILLYTIFRPNHD